MIMTALAVMLAGCDFRAAEDEPAAAKPAPPTPTPAVTESQAKKIIARYASVLNRAGRRLSGSIAADAETGSALEIRKAQYKIFKANKLTTYSYKYTSAVGASPTFSGYPRWFLLAPVDRGTGKRVRNLIIFVQEKAGGPWLAAYTPQAARATGSLGKGIDVPDVAEVVRPDDATLAMAPGRLPAAHADMLAKGRRSPSTRLFQLNKLVTSRYRSVLDSREIFTDLGWKGYYNPVASTHPVYAVRTTSGGALVWYAVDFKTAGRNPGDAAGLLWDNDSWGDLHKPFVGSSKVQSWYTGLERQELVAYVPPKGKGKIQIIAGSWSPVNLRGR